MENRSLPVIAGLIALLAVPFAALAAEDAANAERQAAWQVRLDQASALQAEGRAQQEAADQVLAGKNAECATTFFINDCRNAASREHLESTRQARRLEIDGRAMVREVKREQALERERLSAEEAPKRAAELELRRAEAMNARRATEERVAATLAAKAAKAAEGEKRKAAEAENLRKKQAEHGARVARKKREAEQRAAQAVEAK